MKNWPAWKARLGVGVRRGRLPGTTEQGWPGWSRPCMPREEMRRPRPRHHRGIVHRIRRRTGIDIPLGIDHARMDGVGRRGDGPLRGVQGLRQRPWSTSNDAGCRHAAGSMIMADPGTLCCRIRGAEQCPGRHVNKARIADIGFAVRKRQIQRFCERVDVGRRVRMRQVCRNDRQHGAKKRRFSGLCARGPGVTMPSPPVWPARAT